MAANVPSYVRPGRYVVETVITASAPGERSSTEVVPLVITVLGPRR